MARMEWTAAAVPGEVRRLRHEVCAFAREHGVPESRLEDVALAVTEIVTNAVLHAHQGRPGVIGRIAVAAVVDDGGDLTVDVLDDGTGLLPRDDSPGAGLGMIICDQLADVAYAEPAEGGTQVTMTFALTG
jgi:serine/threonine-protein kinase RsbW